MSELIDTTEMYLRTVYELNEEGVPPMRARIAERLHQSGPTVSQTVARMERDGLLHLGIDRTIQLTDEGQSLAEAVMRKHRLAERLLIDVIGLDWELVHSEACRWEHVISDEVERKLFELLPDTSQSPYGNPIPGMEVFGVTDPAPRFREGNQPFGELLRQADAPVDVVLVRMSEAVQADDALLALLAGAGLRPGVQVTLDPARPLDLAVAGHPPVRVPHGWVIDGLFGRVA
ncbi:metal-dependent transcriptional regulator [Tessaracoccus sp. SD287]|uniref:metal-dependent transcriptional regulator n=1 Tax=Tessaracoccus sp. SD287 TaxID=2782008 RepID=UPI001A96E48A|nr:metal-dependent transcriptional regulator [Tessaracoccus sp. SD287]MBO1031030.1 metal-dependent transcriptional regulator [Tessaracoccus sp. SD287]